MVNYLTETLEEAQYYCKALPNETVKINVNTSDSFRRLIKRLQDDKTVHHTYQVREERAYRLVLRNLLHCIPPNEIQTELETLGHTVRIVLNICHRVTKEPLPLYSVDLEPHDNSKSIYDLLLYKCVLKPLWRVRITTLGLCEAVPYTNHPTAAVKNSAVHKQRAVVRL